MTTPILTLTDLWLLHIEESRQGACLCESWWLGVGGEQCDRGRGIQAQLEHALERDMPAEEDLAPLDLP